MCGSTKAPKVVKDDPVQDAKNAAAAASRTSNAALAQRRQTLAQNSLLTTGPRGLDADGNLLSGKPGTGGTADDGPSVLVGKSGVSNALTSSDKKKRTKTLLGQ